MSTDERREEILRILLGGERTTIPKLVTALKSSKSTIKRDLLVLTVDSGYPIATEQGNGGGIYMMAHRHEHRRILSQAQIAALNVAIQSVDPATAQTLSDMLKAYA